MKITNIEVFLFNKKLSSSMQISRGGFTERFHTIVRVNTDEGLSGLGEGIGNAHAVKSLLEGYYINKVIGADPTNIELIRKLLIDDHVYFENGGSALCAASAIETACWDIKAKEQSLPLYDLLGGKVKDSLEIYASDVYWEEDVSKMVDRATNIIEQGINGVKIHIGYKGPDEDEKRVRAIRESIGNRKFMVDLNCGYDFSQAEKAFELWQKYDLFWIEEPINPRFNKKLKKIRQRYSTPIAWGENTFFASGFEDNIESVDYLMPDIGRVGGIQETLNVFKVANTYNKKVSLHNYSSGILLAATAHVMMTLEGADLLEYDCSSNAVYEELFLERPITKNGYFQLSNSPGLGVELNDDVIGKYAV